MKTRKNLAALALALFTVSCTTVRTNSQYNNPSGFITMEIAPAVVNNHTSVVSLSITNHSQEPAQFGANYTIEKFTNGEWKEFELPTFAVIAIMYMLNPGQTQSYDINLFPDQSDYTPGRYRIVKPFYLAIQGDGYYTAEFTVE